MKNDVYQVVTDRIIRLLESGTVPWHQPWKGGDEWPKNLVSRKRYRGINAFLLHSAMYPSPFWLTFRQVETLGGSVKKGEKSHPVVFWKIFKAENDPEGRRIPFLRYHRVFNVTQCEGIAAPTSQTVAVNPLFRPMEECERVVANMPKPPIIRHQGGRAAYSPSQDIVSMPEAKMFESGEAYYSTLFHELTHATGHTSRLNRKEVVEPHRYGSDPYGREELLAEMGAAFLCGHCAIENKTIEQAAGYIHEWLERLKNDRKLVVHAAAQAQRACDFILHVERDDEDEPVEEHPKEFKVVALRECPSSEEMSICDTPQKAVDYWAAHVATAAHFNPECECCVVVLLNTRRRVKGHHLVSIGTADTMLISPTAVFRTAVISSASAALIIHNHPSGDPTPSAADVKTTRDLIRASQILKIELLDHVIIGRPKYSSLRELGYFND